jgi:plasmid rolling circle replication initiator protein Rep
MTDDEERNLQRLADLEEGLYRKRLISYGGLLKEIHKELNLDDVEDANKDLFGRNIKWKQRNFKIGLPNIINQEVGLI